MASEKAVEMLWKSNQSAYGRVEDKYNLDLCFIHIKQSCCSCLELHFPLKIQSCVAFQHLFLSFEGHEMAKIRKRY